jgi:hypothetical protein
MNGNNDGYLCCIPYNYGQFSTLYACIFQIHVFPTAGNEESNAHNNLYVYKYWFPFVSGLLEMMVDVFNGVWYLNKYNPYIICSPYVLT